MSEPQFEERMMAWIERRWLLATLVVFVGACCWFLWDRWGQIHWLALSDTDDNLRLAQVKAWLAGQSWFDLRQHRLAPPDGLNIHWSRIVDLPIAGILLISRPLVGELAATRIACAVAPMLAMAPALIAIVFAVRRLVHPRAYPIAFAIMMCAQVTLFMWMPLRIDHHGWQLAMLALVVAGLADRDGRRGGAVAGGATAVSFGIGLELIPMMALAGVSIALRWAFDPDETPRLRAYAVVLGGGCALAFAGFASWDNRAMVCDVLSPVYLATLSLTAALLVGISFMPAGGRVARLVLLSVAGIVIAAFFALSFPQCLHRPEAISPELERLWFVNIREVKPLYTKPWRDALDVAWLPVVGTVGAWLALWRARGTATAPGWASVATLALVATLGLFWQSRFGPQAQLMGVLGATALGWSILPRLLDARSALVRVGGTLIAFLALSGLLAQFTTLIPQGGNGQRRSVTQKKATDISRRCATLPSLRELDRLPASTILTFVDFGPRLVAMTRQSAIAGPYHRNGQAILDVQHSFRARSSEVAHEVMKRRGATLLLLCPGMAESTIYAAQAPQGFYQQLMRGEVPSWLAPVHLPDGSPFRLWRRVG